MPWLKQAVANEDVDEILGLINSVKVELDKFPKETIVVEAVSQLVPLAERLISPGPDAAPEDQADASTWQRFITPSIISELKGKASSLNNSIKAIKKMKDLVDTLQKSAGGLKSRSRTPAPMVAPTEVPGQLPLEGI